MSTIHQLGLQKAYFDMIKSGGKTVEGRTAKPKYASFQIGDILEFKAEDKILKTKIVELKNFNSFAEMLNFYSVQACLPDIDNIDEAVKIYRAFPGYAEDEAKFGVIGIKICLTAENEN